MDNLLSVHFEAHNGEKNHHRHYAVTLGRDLLDAWTVAICYGRAGQGGRQLRYASPQPEEMKAVIRDRLRRRLSAPRRIGCPYRLAAFSAAPGFDASAWLPGDVMAASSSRRDPSDSHHPCPPETASGSLAATGAPAARRTSRRSRRIAFGSLMAVATLRPWSLLLGPIPQM
jgi:hypothetical protein